MFHHPLNIFYVRGARKDFKNVIIPYGITKVIHVLGRLESLDGVENFPSTVVELDVSYNFIRDVKGIEKTNIAILKIKSNNIENLDDNITTNIKEINIKGNPCNSKY